MKHKDTLWDLPAVWKKPRVLGSRLPHLRPLQVCLASVWLDHQLGDAVTGKPVLLLVLTPIRGSSLVPALVWGGRVFLPRTAQPTLWALPGDPQAEPKAYSREFGSFCTEVQVILPLPGCPGCSVMHGSTLLLSWEVDWHEGPEPESPGPPVTSGTCAKGRKGRRWGGNADTSSKATLWVKAQPEAALTPPCIVRKHPQVPHTARRGA